MSTLRDEIREELADTDEDEVSRCKLKSLGDGKNTAYTYRCQKQYGVSFEVPDSTPEIDESFSNIMLQNNIIRLENGKTETMLNLFCDKPGFERAFSAMAADFVDPTNRGRIIANPYEWWQEWKEMVGNVDHRQDAYSILGEMVVANYLYQNQQHPVWQGESSVVDIVADCGGCEVKSSILRNNCTVEISSRFQLKHDINPLNLYYCLFERTTSEKSGTSIDDQIKRMVSVGFNKLELEKKLGRLGFKSGKAARKTLYRLIEIRRYPVDNSFPTLTENSFKNDRIPVGITEIKYTVDLSSMKYKTIEYQI
ncbi:MAG: PD-(D/E)XK motif protein [Methanomethylophilus sp.]